MGNCVPNKACLAFVVIFPFLLQKKYLKKVEIGSYPFFRLGKIGVSIVLRSSNKSMISSCYLDINKIIKEKKIKVFKK